MDDNSFLERAQNTLKYEMEGINSLTKLLEDNNFADVVNLLENRKGKIIVTGVGKSGFIAMKIAATLTSLGHNAFFLSPTDALHGDSGMVEDKDVVLALSFSGGTVELNRLIEYIKYNFDVKIVALTGNNSSKLAELSNFCLTYNVQNEGCSLGLAPMASTTASLVIGDMISSALTSPEKFKEKNFAKYHPAGTLGLKLRVVEELMLSKEKTPHIEGIRSFLDAVEMIDDHSLGIVGVVNDAGNLLGCITDGDIRRGIRSGSDMATLSIEKIMSHTPKMVRKETSLYDALSLMESSKITSLFVVDDQNILKGFIHMHTIIENQLKG